MNAEKNGFVKGILRKKNKFFVYLFFSRRGLNVKWLTPSATRNLSPPRPPVHGHTREKSEFSFYFNDLKIIIVSPGAPFAGAGYAGIPDTSFLILSFNRRCCGEGTEIRRYFYT